MNPKKVNVHPTPRRSIISCNTASAVAASAQRTMLAEAAAVDDFVGFKSVRRVPKAYN
jgi:glutamate racemase